MLVLARLANESVDILLPSGETVTVTVVEQRGPKVRLGFDAPDAIKIYRREVLEKIKKGTE